ncbi:hypothetical protein BDZ89DRAFT_1163403 [Hymenopellis radicata]|nr:hypothetical protein BDZ89DRAFT_1163403 [Hymenopellis radicata]
MIDLTISNLALPYSALADFLVASALQLHIYLAVMESTFPVQPVSLQPGSLYVATQTIWAQDGRSIRNDVWHWSFFITDKGGRVVQHHWHAAGVDQSGATTECYQHRPIRQVLSATESSHYVVFAKIGDGVEWDPPEAGILEPWLEGLYKKYEGIPNYRLRTHPDGRLSCRTWIMNALLRFMKENWLSLHHDGFASVEARAQWLKDEVQAPISKTSSEVTAALLAALLEPEYDSRGFQPRMLNLPVFFLYPPAPLSL